jgi:glycosyltransferase involved in cell wall biosynthesis
VLISFLLPTRNRLSYLKLAIETVRRQEDAEWEIVVSDNDSDEDVRGHLEELADDRIVYKRTDRLLPVTDNWNAALRLSRGDYVLMLGDDDGLLPNYLPHLRSLITGFGRPDLVYTAALIFTYPGVDPASPESMLEDTMYAEFFDGGSEPFALSHDYAVRAVRRAMAFRLAFNFNMQLSVISRRLVDALLTRGEFFQSSFPDYYATCAALLNAENIVADPQPRVVVGVTPKSYGYFHLNRREDEGREFLGGQRTQTVPGTNINDGWLSAMEALEANFGGQYDLHVNHRRYRFLQATHVYAARHRGLIHDGEVAQMERALPPAERFLYHAADAAARTLMPLVPQGLWQTLMRRGQGQFPKWDPRRERGRFRDILDVYDHFARQAQVSGEPDHGAIAAAPSAPRAGRPTR